MIVVEVVEEVLVDFLVVISTKGGSGLDDETSRLKGVYDVSELLFLVDTIFSS